jgi:hypothetical protein
VASVVRMTDRMRRHPDAANVTVAEFIHLPVGVSIASLTLEPGAQVTIRKGDDDGEGLFVTHGTGWVAGGHGDREEVVAGNIVYHDRDPGPGCRHRRGHDRASDPRRVHDAGSSGLTRYCRPASTGPAQGGEADGVPWH